jgi:translation initiation factor IF-2
LKGIEVVNLGRAMVRSIVKDNRLGTIASCIVVQGTIERSAKVRLIRHGIVIYPPVDQTVGLDSLRHCNEDASEVGEFSECGIKIAGYDDVRKRDVVEAFRVEQILRTLS